MTSPATISNGSSSTSPAPSPRSGRLWPIGIVAVLSIQAAWIATVIGVATGDPTHAVEPNYYEKAVRWDAAAREHQSWDRLGWSAEISTRTVVHEPGSVQAARLGGGDAKRLVVTLRDRGGVPIENARIEAECFHQARSGERNRWTLEAIEPGVYAGPAALTRSGLWEARLLITRDRDVASVIRTVELQEPDLVHPVPSAPHS